jgi:hypothetical protein
MNAFTKNLRKLMGWCPNAKITEAESRTVPAGFGAYDQSGGEKARNPRVLSLFSRVFSRLDVRLFLPILFFTPVYINLLFWKGVNAEAFCLGFLLSLLSYSFGWNKRMKLYNTLTKKSIIGSSSKKAYLQFFIVLVLIFILVMVFFPYIILFLNIQSVYSFFAGVLILFWGNFFQLIYWERINHMKIYTTFENGFQRTYAIWEK